MRQESYHDIELQQHTHFGHPAHRRAQPEQPRDEEGELAREEEEEEE
eukprot:CAMPEP_0196754052 /NCGR_PEP_ID=MMETSP1091-20130531/92596_1 /TAXON_ID=302021 /ORGANISM="Rhodomonas sp., Strain CCMP768" /LENGTH=46 /DNA_ID= /DNA_START= /DNA_END= /DNA_ORIENTATION=